MTWPAPPPVRERAAAEPEPVLGRDTRPQAALERDGHRLGLLLGERLCREHVLHFAGADAEGQCAEGAVGRSVRITADDGHARLGHAKFRTDHVDDPLILMSPREDGDTELLTVLFERLELAS